MSAFLGPIHHWLYKKISLHEELENDLITTFKNNFGEEVNSIVSKSVTYYGNQISSIPLEEQIDLTNIHYWLQSTIKNTETRLAYILGEMLRKHGEIAMQLALEQYNLQGERCGKVAKNNGASSAPLIYKALNDYLLEGMPCDRANVITESRDDLLVFETTECLHRSYWEDASANIESLYKLRFQWIKSFVNSANSNFEFINKPGDNINSLFINEIKKCS